MSKSFSPFGLGLLTLITLLGIVGPPVSAQVRPAAVKNVDEPGRVPFQAYLTGLKGNGCGTNFCTLNLPAIPTGKRLVITNFAGNAALQSGSTVGDITLIVFNSVSNSTVFSFEVPVNSSYYHTDVIAGSITRFAFNEKTLLFVDAGQTGTIFYYTSGSLADSFTQGFIITGYLVDLTI